MKNYFVDFEGWIKVEAEDAEDAKRAVSRLFWKMHFNEEVLNYNMNFDGVEEEE